PEEIIFVVDAMIGQDAVATAEAFRDGVGITGVVLSKLDGDARGGAALSVRQVTGQPILFASTGEKLEDFDVFHPDRMASRILGMGDVLTLIEQAEAAFEEDQRERMTAKLLGGQQFTLEDFLEQLIAVRRMGPHGRRKAADSPKDKGKGNKGGGGRPRAGGGLPAGFPGGMPALPPGLDPSALDPNAAGLPAGFKPPKIDFSKLNKRNGK